MSTKSKMTDCFKVGDRFRYLGRVWRVIHFEDNCAPITAKEGSFCLEGCPGDVYAEPTDRAKLVLYKCLRKCAGYSRYPKPIKAVEIIR